MLRHSNLSDFVTKSTKDLFEITGLSYSFMAEDPAAWAANPAYVEAVRGVESLQVVNDTAERGVALIQKFNRKHTQNEEQLQYLLLVVQDHRKLVGDFTKSTLSNTVQ